MFSLFVYRCNLRFPWTPAWHWSVLAKFGYFALKLINVLMQLDEFLTY